LDSSRFNSGQIRNFGEPYNYNRVDTSKPVNYESSKLPQIMLLSSNERTPVHVEALALSAEQNLAATKSGAILVPVLLNGVEILGTLDSGASATVMSDKLLTHINYPVTKPTMSFLIAQDKAPAIPMGKLDGITISCGTRTVKGVIHVMPLPKGVSLLLGRDLHVGRKTPDVQGRPIWTTSPDVSGAASHDVGCSESKLPEAATHRIGWGGGVTVR
jgi:hypothetical protein